MKKLNILYFLLILLLTGCSVQEIVLNEDALTSGKIEIASGAEIKADETGKLQITDVIRNDSSFILIGLPNLNLDFTTSSYWVRFKLKSEFDEKQYFLLEAARPLTNVADLYKVQGNKVVETIKNGDEIPFNERKIQHRKLLYHLALLPGEEAEFYMNFKSDGEVLTLPITLWKQEAFLQSDYKEQFILGGYYGTLIFVIIIYFFFFKALKDKTFLYYVLYVVSLVLFQLSMDGLAFQYLWPGNVWLGNHAIIIFASLSVFTINLYAKNYLKTNELLPFCEKMFSILLWLSIVAVALGFTWGKVYAISFPVVNGLALISTLFILVAIILAIKKHCKVSPFFVMAFVFLILGSFLFILTNFSVIPKNLFTEHSIKFGLALEVIFLSITMAERFRTSQKEKEEAQAVALEKLEEINKMREEANVKLEKQVKERTLEIEQQKEQIEEKNADIMDSIHYSQRIQNAILPSQRLIDECLPNSFVLYNPKDVVSGDFYWIAPVTTTNTNEKVVLFCVADCTGHGVPGAFMSLIGNSYLKLSLTEPNVNSPAEALDFLNKGVNSTLKQNDSETLKDGMDIALCAWFTKSNKLYYAGAKNPLYIIKNNELIEIKGDKHPIGAYLDGDLQPFTNHEIKLEGGECFYVFSDGFPDQFGGPKGKKFMYGKFKQLLLDIHHKPMNEQQEILKSTFKEWKGEIEQVDDVCVIGVKI